MAVTVIVDDTDPGIQYSGDWATVDPSTLGSDYDGTTQAIGNTLHNPSGAAASSFSFKFAGSGTFNMFALMSTSTVQSAGGKPFWSCTLNGATIPPPALEQYLVAATQPICSGVLPAGTDNEFTFTINSGAQGQVILFDYLQYTPLSSSSPQSFRYWAVDFTDSGIQYDGTWDLFIPNNLMDHGKTTDSTHDPWLAYTFIGSAITFVANVELSGTANISHATFAIDNQVEETVQLERVLHAFQARVSNKILFQSGTLDLTIPHTLNVTYLTETESAPGLTIQYLIVANDAITASSGSPIASSESAVDSSSTTTIPSTFTIPPTFTTPSTFTVPSTFIPGGDISTTHPATITVFGTSGSIVSGNNISPTTSTTPPSSDSQSALGDSGGKSHNHGPLIGGVVAAGVIVVCLLIALTSKRWRRNSMVAFHF